MQKITKSIRIDPELWKKIRVRVAETDVDISSFVEGAIKKELENK